MESAKLRYGLVSTIEASPATFTCMDNNREKMAEKILAERIQLRAEYGEMFGSLAALLFRYDPAGINFEINPDEYEYEAGKILPLLRACESAADVRRVVHQQFVGSFCAVTAGQPENYEELASEIWGLWKAHQSTGTVNE